MQIVDYVDKELLSHFDANPRESLIEIKKWNNVLNYRKSTPEVKKIRDALSGKLSVILDIIQQSLVSTAKAIDDKVDFVSKWKSASTEYTNLRVLVLAIVEGISEENETKLKGYQEKFESTMKKFCQKCEDELHKMKTVDRAGYEELMSLRIDFNLEDGIYPFIAPKQASQDYLCFVQKLYHCKLDSYLSPDFKKETQTFLKMKETTTSLKQALQGFNFHLEKTEEGLFNLVKSDKTVISLISTLNRKRIGDVLQVASLQEAQDFLQEVILTHPDHH